MWQNPIRDSSFKVWSPFRVRVFGVKVLYSQSSGTRAASADNGTSPREIPLVEGSGVLASGIMSPVN